MRTLLFFLGLYLAHRLALHFYPPYRERMRHFDRKLLWVNVVVVVYLAAHFVIMVLRYVAQ
jgi:hypothetical protein